MTERYIIPSLDRAFDVLEAVAKRHGGLTPAELGRLTGIPKSSLFRILATLKKHRAVVHDESEGVLHLGSRLLELGNQYLDQFEMYRAAYDYMRALAERTGETVFLAQLEDGEVVYTRRVESQRAVTAVRKLGYRAPAHCTATGIGMLSTLPPSEAMYILDEHGTKPYNNATVTDRKEIMMRLEEARRKGYAVVDGEYNTELLCVSAPIIDHYRRPKAALTVAMLSSSRPSPGRISEIGEMVKESAASMSRAAGFNEHRSAAGTESLQVDEPASRVITNNVSTR